MLKVHHERAAITASSLRLPRNIFNQEKNYEILSLSPSTSTRYVYNHKEEIMPHSCVLLIYRTRPEELAL